MPSHSSSFSVTIESIQVGMPKSLGTAGAVDPHNRPWRTGFYKRPVDGPVWVARLNIKGDRQADLAVHGGLHKAVLAYAADHLPAWREELPNLDFAAGAFGENLTIRGAVEADVCLGDTWQAGDVRLQVSQPRQPCWKLARRWRQSDLPKRVVQTGRTGWYFRVLTEGTLTPGDSFQLAERPNPAWTIARTNQVTYAKKSEPDAARELSKIAELAPSWSRKLLGE